MHLDLTCHSGSILAPDYSHCYYFINAMQFPIRYILAMNHLVFKHLVIGAVFLFRILILFRKRALYDMDCLIFSEIFLALYCLLSINSLPLFEIICIL